jgi:putative membrane protein
MSLLNECMKMPLIEKERMYMYWGIGFWPLFPLLWIGIVALFCWGAYRWFASGNRRRSYNHPDQPPGAPSALEILRQRYARGDIDSTTFEQMRERLEHADGPRE